MKLRSSLALVSCSLLLAACGGGDSGDNGAGDASSSAGATADSGAQDLLAEHGLADLDAKEVVDKLDRMAVADRPTDLIASVRPDSLVLSTPDGGDEQSMPMPEDEFYLSLAPYADSTHDCFFHSLTTCKGELSDEEIDVTITSADGETLVDETTTTFDNGFVGYWLPRDVDATITVKRGDEEGTAKITTGQEDLTCLTTLQLT